MAEINQWRMKTLLPNRNLHKNLACFAAYFSVTLSLSLLACFFRHHWTVYDICQFEYIALAYLKSIWNSRGNEIRYVINKSFLDSTKAHFYRFSKDISDFLKAFESIASNNKEKNRKKKFQIGEKFGSLHALWFSISFSK